MYVNEMVTLCKCSCTVLRLIQYIMKSQFLRGGRENAATMATAVGCVGDMERPSGLEAAI